MNSDPMKALASRLAHLSVRVANVATLTPGDAATKTLLGLSDELAVLALNLGRTNSLPWLIVPIDSAEPDRIRAQLIGPDGKGLVILEWANDA